MENGGSPPTPPGAFAELPSLCLRTSRVPGARERSGQENEGESYSDREGSDGGGQRDHDAASFLSGGSGEGHDGDSADRGPDGASDNRSTWNADDHDGEPTDHEFAGAGNCRDMDSDEEASEYVSDNYSAYYGTEESA